MAEQQMQLFRVSERIAGLVNEFFASIPVGSTFRAEDLRSFVDRSCKSAPGSADRIMRLLRANGTVNYTVVSRKNSLYRRESNAT